MRRIVMFLLGGLLLVPTAAWAQVKTTKVNCKGTHGTPNQGAQIRFTAFQFINFDLENPATIERITFRNFDGEIIYDQGPNVDFPVGAPTLDALNVTPVPPGGARAMGTIRVFGFAPIPGPTFVLAEVEWSKEGEENFFVVFSAQVTAERIDTGGGFRVGNFMTVDNPPCFVVPSKKGK